MTKQPKKGEKITGFEPFVLNLLSVQKDIWAAVKLLSSNPDQDNIDRIYETILREVNSLSDTDGITIIQALVRTAAEFGTSLGQEEAVKLLSHIALFVHSDLVRLGAFDALLRLSTLSEIDRFIALCSFEKALVLIYKYIMCLAANYDKETCFKFLNLLDQWLDNNSLNSVWEGKLGLVLDTIKERTWFDREITTRVKEILRKRSRI